MTCITKNKGCQAVYDGTSLSLDNQKLSFARTDVLDGQVFIICVNCTNKAESKQKEIKLV